MKEFKEGDRVICDGIKGVVEFVNHEASSYQVYVEFDNGEADSFTMEGKLLATHDRPSLFHIDDSKTAPVKKKQEWIKVDHAYIRSEIVHIVFQDEGRVFLIVSDKGEVDVTGQYTLEELIDILGVDA